jgi:hypothetical protein
VVLLAGLGVAGTVMATAQTDRPAAVHQSVEQRRGRVTDSRAGFSRARLIRR